MKNTCSKLRYMILWWTRSFNNHIFSTNTRLLTKWTIYVCLQPRAFLQKLLDTHSIFWILLLYHSCLKMIPSAATPTSRVQKSCRSVWIKEDQIQRQVQTLHSSMETWRNWRTNLSWVFDSLLPIISYKSHQEYPLKKWLWSYFHFLPN